MASARRRAPSATLVAVTAFLLSFSMGCWEQWSDDWFPQMKRQKAVQAFEIIELEGLPMNFSPPEGTLPVSGGEVRLDDSDDASANALQNPQARSLESLDNGRLHFERYCSTCHGMGGMGDGPVSMMGELRGPLLGVLPIAGPASIVKVRSDGHLYTTIRNGRRRMPGYDRIPSSDRWDIVNYVRYINNPSGSLQ